VACVQLFIHQYPQVLLRRADLNPFIPQPVLIAGVAPTQMQDLGPGLVEPHEVHSGPHLQLVQVPLDGILSFWLVKHGASCICVQNRENLFINCPSVGLSHGVQSFRNRLLQRGSPMGSQALPANLLLCGLLSPWVRRSWQESAPVRGTPWVHSFLQASTCSGMGSLPQATGGYLLYCGPPWLQGTACLTMVFSVGCRAISAPAPGALPPPPSAVTLVSAEMFRSHSLTLLPSLLFHHRVFFFLFLNMLSQRCYHRC